MLNILKTKIYLRPVIRKAMCQRFKGHSKWQNIKHIKAEKDQQKSDLMQSVVKKLQWAIASANGETNPEKNLQLSKIIENAKKMGISNDSLKSSLQKLIDRKNNGEPKSLILKGPGGILILLHLVTDNIKRTKISLNTICKKYNLTIVDPIPKGLFTHKGIIITNLLKSLERATDDAINNEAEEVEEIVENDSKYLQFVCDSTNLMAVRSKLEKQNYEIIKTEDLYIPKVFVNVNKAQEEVISRIYGKLEVLDEVVDIFNNFSE